MALVGSYELRMMIMLGTQETTGNACPQIEQTAARMPHAHQAQTAEGLADDVTAIDSRICAKLHLGQPRPQLVRAYLVTLAGG